jgi:N-acyl-D-aspartate/D-glutamate deacylase
MHLSFRECAVVLLALGCSGSPQPVRAESFDTIIRHGMIIDGTGRPRFIADVAVRDGYIAKIGDLHADTAALDINAAGQFVAPGFINIHSHAEAEALPTAVNMLAQGVTTEILYPDGDGPTDLSAALRKVAAGGLAENIGGYIGFNGVWQSVMGPSDHRASPADIQKMRALVEEGLQQGAWGISAGLDYKPAYFATTEEVTEVVSAGAPWRTNFPDHERVTPPQFSSRAGIAETIQIGTQAGVAPEITHIKAQGHEQGSAGEILAMMSRASRAGHYTPADVYPYLAGLTGLQDLLIPGWAQDGGAVAMRNRFKDPEQRARIARESEAAMNARLTGGAKGVQLPQLHKSLVDIMQAEKVGAGEAVIRTLEAAGDQEIYALLQFGAEADLEAFLRYESTAVACDCGATLQKLTHPRFYGTFPKVLGHYVRDAKLLSWEQAIMKMTALPASIIGLVDRGLLSVGMHADITVFDPNTIRDRATFTEPAVLPEGVREVLVNGRSVWHAGMPTGATGGSLLVRTRHMPTRPMNSNQYQHVQIQSTLRSLGESEGAATAELRLDLARGGPGKRTTGQLRISGPGAASLTFVDFGELQWSERWFAITGSARSAAKIEPVSLTLDAADPAMDPQFAVLIVDSPTHHAEWRLPASALHTEAR